MNNSTYLLLFNNNNSFIKSLLIYVFSVLITPYTLVIFYCMARVQFINDAVHIDTLMAALFIVEGIPKFIYVHRDHLGSRSSYFYVLNSRKLEKVNE